MDIRTQTFRESYTDYYNQKILANENADENDWRSMSDKQWDKMLDGIDDYVDDFKENLKRLKEMQDKAADRAAADARSDMRANAAASAALRTAAYGFVSQTVAGDDTSDKADYELTDGLFPSDPEETKAVNMSKTQEALLTGSTSAGISGTESTRETASTSDDDENVTWYITVFSEQGISCASFDKDGNKTELWDIPYNNSSDYKKVLDFLDRFEKDANLKFSSDKQFWVDFLAGNIDVDKIVKEYSGD